MRAGWAHQRAVGRKRTMMPNSPTQTDEKTDKMDIRPVGVGLTSVAAACSDEGRHPSLLRALTKADRTCSSICFKSMLQWGAWLFGSKNRVKNRHTVTIPMCPHAFEGSDLTNVVVDAFNGSTSISRWGAPTKLTTVLA